jgi:transposase-like protein
MEFGDEWLDAQFPLGDGVADTSAVVECPHCGHQNEIALDPGGAAVQRYIEDCETCCRPLQLTVRWNATGQAEVDAAPEDDS